MLPLVAAHLENTHTLTDTHIYTHILPIIAAQLESIHTDTHMHTLTHTYTDTYVHTHMLPFVTAHLESTHTHTHAHASGTRCPLREHTSMHAYTQTQSTFGAQAGVCSHPASGRHATDSAGLSY